MSTAVETPLCLVCDTAFEIDADWEKGEITECGACGQEHEIVEKSGDLVRVDLAPEVEEDWGE
ncbi:lysine biosynthesis protein LysW [Streptomyces beihaiensis]|uniref:Lysine biosynthesis protein LysW n=1 Tax=Streptomyces beihaiensis TaxID=2984495 RepID=A0ABT3TXR4_9ACTN|nr:lysine biosynthesis protein LysW [Streptomyces beihaiensis]MCX3061847.1 lysine biosynthesis protein LysW [Streptomyces beihaiensis]